MNKKNSTIAIKTLLILFLSVIAITVLIQTANAAEITSAKLDKDIFLAGQTGSISVDVYNDRTETIRVTELSAKVEYHYDDGTVYVQTFFTGEELPHEIEAGTTETFQVQISLPTNIAPGYMDFVVVARTEMWVSILERWIANDNPNYHVNLYVESPYKQSYEDSLDELQNSQLQLEAQEEANRNLSVTATILGVTTLALGAVAAVLLFTFRRPRPIAS